MSGSISFNPYLTNQPQDSFLLQSQGYIQGTVYDDPTARLELAGGTLATSETLVMWGGVPISEAVNVAGAGADGLGPVLKRATTAGGLTGFSTYNQANNMVIAPGQTAPAVGIGGGVLFFRIGSNIRIAVKFDSTVSVTGDATNVALYWDATNYQVTTTVGSNILLPATTRLLSTNTNSKIVAYNSGTGAVTWTTGAAAMILI